MWPLSNYLILILYFFGKLKYILYRVSYLCQVITPIFIVFSKDAIFFRHSCTYDVWLKTFLYIYFCLQRFHSHSDIFEVISGMHTQNTMVAYLWMHRRSLPLKDHWGGKSNEWEKEGWFSLLLSIKGLKFCCFEPLHTKILKIFYLIVF